VLTLPVTTDERLRLAKFDTGDPDAYREYLLGRHFWRQRTPAAMDRPYSPRTFLVRRERRSRINLLHRAKERVVRHP